MTCRVSLVVVLLALAACATAPTPPANTTWPKSGTPVKAELRPSVTVWYGTRNLDTTFTVGQGEQLVIRPGTVLKVGPAGTIIVMGQAVFEGSPKKPVRIEGDPNALSAVVQVRHPSATVTIRHAVMANAKIGVAATEGSIQATDVRFENNRTGFTVEASARATLSGGYFTGNELGLLAGNGGTFEGSELTFSDNQTGFQATRSAKVRLAHSTFTGNRVGYAQQNACDAVLKTVGFSSNDRAVALVQTRRSPTIRHGNFTDNPVAIAATLFSNPLVEASTFTANGRGLAADQFSVPFLRFNRFEKNEGAVRLDKRSGARIEGNLFEGNGVALFADFSSYPRVTGNRFENNRWHVKLGIYESADFERRFGSGDIMRGEIRDRNTRNPLLMKDRMPSQEKTFTLSGNDWDEATRQEMAAGPDENLSRFWDGRDQDPVSYEGFGSESYAIDVIVYAPPLEEQPRVGPEAWHPLPATAGEPAPERQRKRHRPAKPIESQPSGKPGFKPTGS